MEKTEGVFTSARRQRQSRSRAGHPFPLLSLLRYVEDELGKFVAR